MLKNELAGMGISPMAGTGAFSGATAGDLWHHAALRAAFKADCVFFLLKKVVAGLLAPASIFVFLAFAAAVARWLKRPRLALWLIVSSVTVMYAGSIHLVSDALLAPLEQEYPRLAEALRPVGVTRIVVLGSGYVPDARLPITAELSPEGVVRVVEGVRLFRSLGLQQLVLSGGRGTDPAPSARGYAELAGDLGVSPDAMVVLDRANDTAQEAKAIRALLGDTPFVLVTSASHMPRAMRLMTAAGLHAFPAPTAHRVKGTEHFKLRWLVPDGTALNGTETALHEYLGLLALSVGVK